MIHYIKNIEENLRTNPDVVEAKILYHAPDWSSSQLYYRLRVTGMSDRDSMVSFEMFDLDDGRTFFLTKTIDHPDYPPTSKIIRLEIHKAS